jgi:hypothetical protein
MKRLSEKQFKTMLTEIEKILDKNGLNSGNLILMTTYINDPMDVELFCHADGSNDVFPLIHNVMQGVFEELKTQSEFFNLNLN